ncbi:MAG: T9SS type A sorting domain-containing protein [Chitinophagaceae bacterium]|jgi:alpha-tubulin suppressor-like RCC1 family protein
MKKLLLTLTSILTVQAAFAQCPNYGPRKPIASSYHSTIMIDYNNKVLYWGQEANPVTFADVLKPDTLTGYAGTPLSVAAGSVTTDNNVLFLHTTSGIWGWGENNNTISFGGVVGNIGFTKLTLPTGVDSTNINFIEGSNCGLALVTKNGAVYIKQGNGGGGLSALIYGDGTTGTSFDGAWHKVRKSASLGDTLTGVTMLSFASRGLMALTSGGDVYVWGNLVYDGTGSIAADEPYATLVTKPAGVVASDINIVTKDQYNTNARNASQFILGTNGKVYGLGNNFHGVLGQGTTDSSASWLTVKGPGGVGDLTGIIQISSNNVYHKNTMYANIGAVKNDGDLYLWGNNDSRMVGSDLFAVPVVDPSFYNLPRIPPNFNRNGAKVGFLEMGGHTAMAFLSGTSRFCYIGHKFHGSMGDNVVADEARPAFDCINTPESFICPPQPFLGCPLPSTSDIFASSSHGTLVINGQPSVTFWGEASSSAEAGVDVALPKVLYEYSGVPKGVAASGISEGTATQATQMWLQTSDGIWGWGYSGNTIQINRAGIVPMTKISLPDTVTAGGVNFIRSSRGGLALVTNTGNVWVLAGNTSACSGRIYGIGTSTLDAAGSTVWHRVTDASSVPLTNVIDMSFAGTAAIAITSGGQAYVWGDQTFLGNGSAVADRDRATLMTMPTGVIPGSAEIIQTTGNEAVQFILGKNRRIYCVGRNLNGALGKGIGTTATVITSWDSLSLAGIRKLSSNNPYANGIYTVGAISLTGDISFWGSNSNGMIGQGATANITSPTSPAAIAAGDAINFEIGGHHTIVFVKSSSQFYFAGHNTGGAKGDGSAAGNYTTFTLGASVPNCAGLSFDLTGNLFNDVTAQTNNLIDGAGIQTLRTTPMYANLLDEYGYLIAKTPITATGTYSFLQYPFGNYFVKLSTTSDVLYEIAPNNPLPDNWVYTGEQIGTTPSVGIDGGIADGKIAVALTTNVSNVNFGVQQLPTPVADTLARLANPGGIITRNITSGFTGLDTSGTIAKIHITGFPTNTTSIKIGATTYTSGTWPGAGVTFTTATSVDIDPVDGAVIAVIPFKVFDNADMESTNPANLTVPFMLIPPVANNITAPRLNSSDTAKAIPQLKASNPSGTAIISYKIESLPLPTEGKLYYCAAAPSTCALGSLTLAVAGVNITPAQSASLYFDPVQSFLGTASFTYSATDQNNLVSNTANYSIPVTNNPPVTQNIRTSQIIDTQHASTLPDLIGADMDGTVVSYTVSSIPSSALGMLSYCSTGDSTCTGVMTNITGTTVLTPAQMNTMRFDPVLGFSGDFVFNYIATDNNSNPSNTSTYTIPVVPLAGLGGNFPPVATNIKAQNINNSLGATPIPNLLGTDPDGLVVTYTIGATIPNSGTEGTLYYCNTPGLGCALSPVTASLPMTPAQVQTLQFDPVSSFIGNASFTYTVTDNNGTPLTSSPATYTIPVVNNPPVANPSSVSPILNTITTPTLLPPLSGNDADGTVVSYNITSVPLAADGTLKYCATAPAACTPATLTTISGPLSGLTPDQAKTINFIPNSSFTGDYIFNFTTVDNNGLVSLPAAVTIPVVAIYPTNVGEPPVAYSFNAAAINSLSTASLSTALTGTDPDGTVVTYTVTSIPAASHGGVSYCVTPGLGCATSPVTAGLVLTPAQAATLVFTPDVNFTGIATFNYINTDNSGNTSNTATVTIPVNNNPPVASNINNTAISRSSPAVTLNPLASTDGDGTVVSYKILTVPTSEQGTLRLCTTPPATGCTDVTPGQVIQPADIGKLSFTPNAYAQTPVVGFLYSTMDNSGNLSNIAAVNVPLMDAFPLPMDLISFTATKQNINALIAWKIGVEEAGDIYTLEHSPNASNWKTINVQNAKNTSSVNHLYDFLHLNVPSGNNFYRLKMETVANSVSYSPVRMLNFDGTAAPGVFIQPNPVADKLYLSSSDGSVISKVVIRDLSGRKINEYKGLNSGSFIDMSSLNAGLYIINVTDNNGKEEIFKVTKSK